MERVSLYFFLASHPFFHVIICSKAPFPFVLIQQKFSHLSGGSQPRFGCLHNWVLVRTVILACWRPPFLWVLIWQKEKAWEREREVGRERECTIRLWCLFLEGHQFHHEGPSLMTSSKPNYCPKAWPLHPITLGIRTSTYKSGRTQSSPPARCQQQCGCLSNIHSGNKKSIAFTIIIS